MRVLCGHCEQAAVAAQLEPPHNAVPALPEAWQERQIPPCARSCSSKALHHGVGSMEGYEMTACSLARGTQWHRMTAWLVGAQHGATKEFGKVLVPDHTPKVKVRSARFE